MNTQEIKMQRLESEFLNNRFNNNGLSERNRAQVHRKKSLRGEDFSTTQANRITMVEDSLTFGYIHLQPNMKLALGDLKESKNVFHVVSGLGLVKSDMQVKILSRGLTIKVNEQNKDHELVTFDNEELTLVWWDEVAEEDWFHNNLF